MNKNTFKIVKNSGILTLLTVLFLSTISWRNVDIQVRTPVNTNKQSLAYERFPASAALYVRPELLRDFTKSRKAV